MKIEFRCQNAGIVLEMVDGEQTHKSATKFLEWAKYVPEYIWAPVADLAKQLAAGAPASILTETDSRHLFAVIVDGTKIWTREASEFAPGTWVRTGVLVLV